MDTEQNGIARRAVLAAGAAAGTLPFAVRAQETGMTMTASGSGLDPQSRATLARLDPDLPARFEAAVAAGTGDLDDRSRALVGLAALAARGGEATSFEARVRGALAAGVTTSQIVEIGYLVAVYAGFPAAQEALQRSKSVFGATNAAHRPTSGRPEGNDRALGLANLRQTGGEEAARQWAASSSEVAPLTVSFAHGEILNRPALNLRDRQIATLAMLTALGGQDDALTYHVAASRRAGWSREALVEAMAETAHWVGVTPLLGAVEPALAGLARPVERVPERAVPRSEDAVAAPSDAERLEKGQQALDEISQSSGQAVVSSFDDIAPDLGHYILEFAYGDVFSRPGLDFKLRELTTVAALAATGRTVDAVPLNVHVNAALNVGASPREVVEALLHMLPYVGFPRVQKAMAAAEAVFAERELELLPARNPDTPALTIIGTLQAKPGLGGELREALEPVVAASRQEPGCINYDLHVDAGNPDRFMLYENWADQAALDRHFEQLHSKALAARFDELLAEPLKMDCLTEISDWIGRRS
ncbi:carboxymuconolactone decarboxylase family protein [Qipengyuania qiaonensis]|uniref:Carboxymuconolactone decarboxylase family protein n=1 Tax=Qipengyuania qiaonensis TaxID=2867240 RepID=A0ABS7JDV5_9SPHN|nr:carboxymuconolactone decarboxylase family protein [Qipengyuania qiaonensis]MBX7484034.1 carboxymuconolactone decarboxylase family protein [Qipengyuania qiaonensis]